MKQLVYLLGVFAGLAIIIGLVFKTQHWLGADAILAIAALCSIIFVPLFAIYQYKKDKN